MARRKKPARSSAGARAGGGAAVVAVPKTRKESKGLWLRAKQLSRETPWLLHRDRDRLGRDLLWELADATRALRALLAVGFKHADFSRLARQTSALDERLSQEVPKRRSERQRYWGGIRNALLVALFIRAFMFEAYLIPSGSMIPTLMVGDYLFVSKFVYGIPIPFTNHRLWSWRSPARGEVIIFTHPDPKEDNEILIKRVMATPGDHMRLTANVVYINGKAAGSPHVLDRNKPCFYSKKEGGGGRRCNFVEESSDRYTWITQHTSDSLSSILPAPLEDWPIEPDHPTNLKLVMSGYEPLWPDAKQWDTYIEVSPDGYPELVVPEGHIFVMGDNRDSSADGRFWGLVPLERVKGKALFFWYANNPIAGTGSWSDYLGRVFRTIH